MGRKIAIVGATIEGFMQLALLVRNRRVYREYADDEYILIHDPDKVYNFQLATPGVAFFETLEREIHITKRWMKQYTDEIEGCGFKYIGWGNKHNFFLSGCNHTFDINKFRDEFIKDGGQIFGPNVQIVEKRIDSFEADDDKCLINGDKYDYVIDCTQKEPLGWETDYQSPSVEFSNSAIIVEKPVASTWNYTIEYAAKHGHIVGIPLKNKQVWSYFYHDDYSTIDEVKEDFETILPGEDLTNNITWNPRVSNYVIHPDNKRYFKNGNALINIDLSVVFGAEYTEYLGYQIADYIFGQGDKEQIETVTQSQYIEYILRTLQSYVCFLHQYGSIHQSKYWEMAQFKSCEYLESAIFHHPNVFPGHKWRNEMITDEWDDEELKMAHHRHLLYEDEWTRKEDKLPYMWMTNSTLFYDLAIGLDAPYADKLKTMGNTIPSEEFGVLNV